MRTSRSIQLGPSARVVDSARTYLTLLFHNGLRALAYQLSVLQKMRFSEDAIPAAAFVFERENGRTLLPHEESEITKHGFETIDPDLLVKGLLKELTNERNVPDSRYRSSSYWALGKRYDPSLIEFFRDSLRKELKRDMESAYQIMISLENLEESVFSSSSASITKYDENRKDAEEYLKKVEPGSPYNSSQSLRD